MGGKAENHIDGLIRRMCPPPTLPGSPDAVGQLVPADALGLIDRAQGHREFARGFGCPPGRALSQAFNLRQQLRKSEAHCQT